jgi:hypothetical protein
MPTTIISLALSQNRTKPVHKHERLTEFLVIGRVIIFCFSTFLFRLGFLSGVELQPVPRGNLEPASATNFGSLGAPVGSGDCAKRRFQRRSSPAAYSPCRRSVETSCDVIEHIFTCAPDNLSSFLLQNQSCPSALFRPAGNEPSTMPSLLWHSSPGDKNENCSAQFLAVCWIVRVEFKVHRPQQGDKNLAAVVPRCRSSA